MTQQRLILKRNGVVLFDTGWSDIEVEIDTKVEYGEAKRTWGGDVVRAAPPETAECTVSIMDRSQPQRREVPFRLEFPRVEFPEFGMREGFAALGYLMDEDRRLKPEPVKKKPKPKPKPPNEIRQIILPEYHDEDDEDEEWGE